jgi:hypothetical protein
LDARRRVVGDAVGRIDPESIVGAVADSIAEGAPAEP